MQLQNATLRVYCWRWTDGGYKIHQESQVIRIPYYLLVLKSRLWSIYRLWMLGVKSK